MIERTTIVAALAAVLSQPLPASANEPSSPRPGIGSTNWNDMMSRRRTDSVRAAPPLTREPSRTIRLPRSGATVRMRGDRFETRATFEARLRTVLEHRHARAAVRRSPGYAAEHVSTRLGLPRWGRTTRALRDIYRRTIVTQEEIHRNLAVDVEVASELHASVEHDAVRPNDREVVAIAASVDARLGEIATEAIDPDARVQPQMGLVGHPVSIRRGVIRDALAAVFSAIHGVNTTDAQLVGMREGPNGDNEYRVIVDLRRPIGWVRTGPNRTATATRLELHFSDFHHLVDAFPVVGDEGAL